MKGKLSGTNQSVRKAFIIVEALAAQGQPMRLHDIAAKVDMPAPTVLRFLITLTELGYVFQTRNSLRYALTLKLTSLGTQVSAHFSIRSVVHPFLEELAELSGESCFLASEVNGGAYTLDVLSGHHGALQIVRNPGDVAPLYRTGAGKLFLLDYSPEELEAYLNGVEFKAVTKKTITSASGFRKAMALAAQNGYALDNEESEAGIRSVTVPVRNVNGKTVYALGIVAPVTRLSDKTISAMLPRLWSSASEIGNLLG